MVGRGVNRCVHKGTRPMSRSTIYLHPIRTNEPPAMNAQPSSWFHAFRGRAFPTATLPTDLATYVKLEAARFGVDEALVAVTALARLGGTLAENRGVPAPSGCAVPLLLRVIMAIPSDVGAVAIRESGHAMEAIQAERLQVAAGLDRRRIAALLEGPIFRLPGYAAVPGGDPRMVAEAREHALQVVQQPLFMLTSPGSRELRNGFAASFDHTVFATFDGDLLEPLLTPRRDREERQLGDLVTRLCRGSQIDVPALMAGRMVQPRFGFLCTTTADTLARAVTSDLDDVHSLVRQVILLDVSGSNAVPTRVAARDIAAAGAFWKNLVGALHQQRLDRTDGTGPHSTFYEPLAGWHQRWQSLSTLTPERFRPHLKAFAELPHQLANLFLAIGTYGVWRDVNAAQGALEISEWLLAQTLLVAADAHAAAERSAVAAAKEKMLSKIVEFGPIDLWRLCRRYDKQDKAIHEPVLHRLLDEKLVRLNPEGKLIAA